MIYLDNAATTYPKPKCVYTALRRCLRCAVGNPGRSSHRAALAAAEEIYLARETLAEFLCFDAPERIVFTQNATYALNMALRSLTPRPRHTICSNREHNSVIRPLEAMRAEGAEYTVFNVGTDPLSDMESALRPDTDLCILSLCSNVTGECFPLSVLEEFRKRHPTVRIILDGSQWLGHLPLALDAKLCDVLCAPGHKALFGLQGAGFAAFATEHPCTPFAHGGSGNDSKSAAMPEKLPERLEAGTLATPSIATLRAGTRFLINEGMDTVAQKLKSLTSALYERLDSLTHFRLLSNEGFGIAAFVADGIPSSTVGDFLDARGICVRAGLHCAPLLHTFHGTDGSGAVRASLSYLTEKNALDRLYRALREFEETYY